MDYLDPTKSIYAVPYTAAKRFSITLSCMSSAYILGAGPSGVLIDDLAAIPINMIACVWTGPIAALAIPFTFFAFIYVVFTERPLGLVVSVSAILVYAHCARLNWWVGAFCASVGLGAGAYLLYRLVRKNQGS